MIEIGKYNQTTKYNRRCPNSNSKYYSFNGKRFDQWTVELH